MSEIAKIPLPDYDHPPVIEVVCGIQFEPLARYQATSPGLFWPVIREEYPNTQEVAPLASVVERFPQDDKNDGARMELSDIPPVPRVFFVHRTPNWLAQLQRDRFLHNWRKVNETDTYPHYPTVFEKFWELWEKWTTFCIAEDLGHLSINQLEITYINHIPAGTAWSRLAEVGRLFPDLSWRTSRRFLPEPGSLAWRTHFTLPDRQGRLHVSTSHAIRAADKRPVLLCELVARGMPANDGDSAIKDWFAMGREWIVRGFADLTSEEVQNSIWGRKACSWHR